jgi:hypothetical protein
MKPYAVSLMTRQPRLIARCATDRRAPKRVQTARFELASLNAFTKFVFRRRLHGMNTANARRFRTASTTRSRFLSPQRWARCEETPHIREQ